MKGCLVPLLAGAVLACHLRPVRGAESNPEYATWSGFKVGAWVRLDDGSQAETIKKLVGLTPEKATIQETTISGEGGVKVASRPVWMEITVHLPPPAPADKNKTKQTGQRQQKQGEEVVQIKGKGVQCQWKEETWKDSFSYPGHRVSTTYMDRTWTSRSIPGGLVKSWSETTTVIDGKPEVVRSARILLEWGNELSADREMNNPEYGLWSGFKPGAWVKFKKVTRDTSMSSVPLKGALFPESKPFEEEATQTLVELTDERAVVEIVSANPKQKQQWRETIPSKVWRVPGSVGGREVEEEIEVVGKKMRCRRLSQEQTFPRIGKRLETKQWRCAQIPGGVAKMITTTINGLLPNQYPTKSTETLTVVEWKSP